MRNYITDKKGTEQFIREVKKGANGTLTLKFADGKVFKNITACDENINKIIETQELLETTCDSRELIPEMFSSVHNLINLNCVLFANWKSCFCLVFVLVV